MVPENKPSLARKQMLMRPIRFMFAFQSGHFKISGLSPYSETFQSLRITNFSMLSHNINSFQVFPPWFMINRALRFFEEP